MFFCTIVNHSIDKNIQKIHVDFFNNYYDLVVSARCSNVVFPVFATQEESYIISL